MEGGHRNLCWFLICCRFSLSMRHGELRVTLLKTFFNLCLSVYSESPGRQTIIGDDSRSLYCNQ